MSIVIVGGGIVGMTAAYYLQQKNKKVTLVEKCDIGCHSSGKAGGFLTDGDSGWHRGPIAKLAKHSFVLHGELAKEFGPEAIGFRRVKCVGHGRGTDPTPGWLKHAFANDMGDQRSMAQVSPLKLMAALRTAVLSKEGCELVIGKAIGVEISEEVVSGVRIRQEGKEDWVMPCEGVVLGMGCWAREAADWFPDSPMPRDTVSSRYTSVIWDDTEVGKDATMVFISDKHHVEMYPREDECYANGCPTSCELPDNPADIVPPPQTIEDIKEETFTAVERLRDAKVIRTTACFLAGSEDNKPVVGLVPKTKNAVIACGGGCWGITNGPAMGHAAAALVTGEEPALSLAPFDPSRFGQAGAGVSAAGLPPKLLALLAQNPALAEMMRQNPEAVIAYLQQLTNDD